MEDCKSSGCKQGSTICGIVLLVIATILTLITLNGIAILGMFIVGVMLLCHKNWRCASSCPCCDEGTCDTKKTKCSTK
jgi:hypothetical protein